jgi:archaeosine synthase beta-subunit
MNLVQLTDRWILERRGPKAVLDPTRPYAAVWEEERDESGERASTAVVFLTNRECPFRCVMCDLWVNTLDDVVPDGAIAQQIRTALTALPPARQIKLYNAGSFFDAQAIPPSEDDDIARLLEPFERVIVEAHPAYLRGPYSERCLAFRDRLRAVRRAAGRDDGPGRRSATHEGGRLEVAIGLETAHPHVLARLNKRMTLDDFTGAAQFLRRHDIDVRAFILLQPPFMPAGEAVEWGCRSIDVAFDAGAGVCAVIPTRTGNGAMEAIGAVPPALTALESVIEYGLAIGRGRVFADLWDIERRFACRCSAARAARLRTMNDTQRIPTPILCDCTTRH